MKKTETAVFAGGCFWCTEAIFRRLKGVTNVEPGYAGGQTENPNYDSIHTGRTGHAEAVRITFDPSVISYDKLLEVFWASHNPTLLNRQGNDIGSEYRSLILYKDKDQKVQAERSKQKLEKEHVYEEEIVTEIAPLDTFYPAEAYHRDFYEKYKDEPYCVYIINPKIKKLLSEFGADIKEEFKIED